MEVIKLDDDGPTIIYTYWEPELSSVVENSQADQFDLVKVAPTTYMLVEAGWQRWEFLEAVYLSRLHLLVRKSKAPLVLSRRSAAFVHGLWLPHRNHRIDCVSQTRTRVSYPAGSSRKWDWRIPSVTVARCVDETGLRNGRVQRAGSLPVTDIDTTVLDCLQYCEPKIGFLVACCALAKLSNADPFGRIETEERARSVIRRWKKLLNQRDGRWGMRRANRLLRWVTPWCQSSLEAELILFLRQNDFGSFEQQYEVATQDKAYFVDCLLNYRGLKVALEMDGLTKTGKDIDSFRDYQRRDLVRDRTLLANGIDKILHLNASDLPKMHAFLGEIG